MSDLKSSCKKVVCPNGFTSEFFQTFTEEILLTCHELSENIRGWDIFQLSLRGHITSIPKPDKTARKNYRSLDAQRRPQCFPEYKRTTGKAAPWSQKKLPKSYHLTLKQTKQKTLVLYKHKCDRQNSGPSEVHVLTLRSVSMLGYMARRNY